MPDTKFFQWTYPEENEDPHYEKLSQFFTRIDDQAFAMLNTVGNVVIPPDTLSWDFTTNTLTWDTFFEIPLMSLNFSIKAEYAPDGVSKSVIIPDGYRLTVVIPNTSSGNSSVLLAVTGGNIVAQHGLMTLGFARGTKFFANLPQVFT